MASENKWTLLLVALVCVWAAVLGSTIYPKISGDQPLVDPTINLTLVTLPLLAFNMLYFGMLIFVFIVYLAVYGKTKNRQARAISEYNSNPLNLIRRPLCTIVIPARNEASVIKRTINNCLDQTYHNLELIVVCHNCTDLTFEQAKSVNDGRVHAYRLDTAEAGKGIALNFGVQKSRGEYILVLDGDGILSADFIANAIPLLENDKKTAAVQGRYVPSNRGFNLLTRLLSLEGDLWSTPYMTLRDFFGRRTPLGGTGYIIKRLALLKVGMFANHLVDDYELTFRLLRSGYRISFAPLCINYDEKPPSLDIMFRQRARWGKGFLQLLKMRITDRRDIIGFVYWLSPVSAFTGLAMLLIPGIAAFYNALFGYFPFTYSFLSLETWTALTITAISLQAAALLRSYGRKGLPLVAQTLFLIPFSNYWYVSFIKAFGVKSWSNTKTSHGFVTEEVQNIARDVA
ncbi:MAG: glycosyltransferase [Nitrososphaera sp.]